MIKSRRRSWTLSPRDLPHPSVIKDEPLLQDMENNAAFRMLTFRLKRRKPLDLWKLWGVGIILCLIKFGWMQTVIAAVALLIVHTTWAQTHKHQSMHLKGLDRQILADLNTAAVHPLDIISALWASVLPRRPRLFLYCIPLVFTLLAICFGAYYFDPILTWIGIPFLMIVAHSFAERRHLPYRGLPELEKLVNESALAAGCWVPPTQTAKGCARDFALFLLFIVFCVAIGLISANPPAFDFEKYLRLGMNIVSHPASVALGVVSSVVVGFLIGDWYGNRLRRRSERILTRLQRQVWKMLDLASEDIT